MLRQFSDWGFALFLACFLVTTGAAAKDGPNIQPGAAGSDATAVERLASANELYAIGRSEGDPILVIAAARLAAGVPVQEIQRTAETIGGTPSKKEKSAGVPDLKSMIATARDLAGDNRTLNAMIDDVEATKPKGRLRGPGRAQSSVKANGTTVFKGKDLVFRGGEVAEIAVMGDGDANLDLFVFDELNNQICASSRYADREYCRWTPRWTGPFRIEVR
ncbi:MAG: hypothetical protein AAF942_14715, partial [Pseudomonadota bacterium]